MPYLAFVGPGLRLLQRGLVFLAAKSDANPNASGLAAIAAAGGTYLGFDPATLAAIGRAVVALGRAMGG